MVANPPLVPLPDLPQPGRADMAPAEGALGEEHVVRQVAQVAPQPPGQGNLEPLLGPMDHGAGHAPLEMALEQILRDPAPVLELRRDRGRELDEPVVEERAADLEPVGHAHPVHLDQHAVGEPRLEIDVEELAEGVEPANPLEVPREGPEGVVTAQRGFKLVREQPTLLVGPEEREVREVGPLERGPEVLEEVAGPQRAGHPVRLGIDAAERPQHPRAKPGRQPATQAGLGAIEPVAALIAREDLVAAVSRQSHGDALAGGLGDVVRRQRRRDRKSTRLNSSHEWKSYAVFCSKKKKESPKTCETNSSMVTLLARSAGEITFCDTAVKGPEWR